MLRIENLGKQFGDHSLFQGLNLRFGPGCVALSEEESTGKSTFLSLVAGRLPLGQGDIWIDGYSMREQPAAAKGRLAYIPEDCMVYPAMAGRERCERVGARSPAWGGEEVLDSAAQLELGPHREKLFQQMSTVTRRKRLLAAAAPGTPSVPVA